MISKRVCIGELFMLSGYRNLTISRKLLLSNLAFALPMVVLIFFMNISFSCDIDIGRTELAGTRYLRSLTLLLGHVSEYRFVDAIKKEDTAEKVQDVFASLDTLHKNHPVLLNEGSLSLQSLEAFWNDGQLDSTQQEKLLNNVQDFIVQIGQNSKLILDPALDSRILAEILVSLLPSHCNALNRLIHRMNLNGLNVSSNQKGASTPHVFDNMQNNVTLFQSGAEKIITEGKRVLVEDANYYGVSSSLHENFGPALGKYQQAVNGFFSLVNKGKSHPVSAEAMLVAGQRLGSECRQLFLIGLDELDILIAKRITSYQKWRLFGFACSALALLLASFYIFILSKSITSPVRTIIAYTRKIGDGDYRAPLVGDFQAELKTLANDLKGMVKKIVDLAAFPLENPTPVFASDMFGGILYINPAAEKVMKSLGIELKEFLPPNHREIVSACLAGCRDCSETESAVHDLTFSWNYYPLVGQNIVHIYAHDITLQKQLAAQLQHDAFHDGLTGLPNRALFIDRLQQVVRRSGALKTDFAVFFLDLDRFKLVNESLGHESGDQLLKTAAKRIYSLVEEGATLARLGGDEFVLLMEDVNIHQAIAAAKRILKGMKEHYFINDNEISVTSSIGIVVGRSSEFLTAEDVLRDADTAMYRAKANGGDGYMVFEDTMYQKALARLEMEVALKRGLERDEFVVFYQPIVDLLTDRIAGFEALVRWQSPEKGLVPPGDFIPLAEETNLIVPLGRKILSMACHQARRWQKDIAGNEELMISVNMAVPQLANVNLMEEIDAVLLESDLPAHSLKIEITESGIMEDVEKSLVVLSEIKQRYIALGIDDFGTGYSSLSYLHQFPFDTLKVDRSFVVEMEKDEKNKQIIETIVTLAHTLHKQVIVEGIETKEQLDQIKQLGCEFGQGDYFAKPLPAEEAGNFLKNS